MKILKYIVVVPAMTLCLVCTAQTHDHPHPPKGKKGGPPTFEELLKDLDANNDGQLALSEVKGPLKKDFKKIDTDKDGQITEDELKKMKPPKGPRRKQ